MILVLATLIAAGFGMLGAFMALRTGSGEAIQALFPVLFIFLFMSSMNAPRNLMEVDWFRAIATINPVSYLIEAVRSLIITGWNLKALSLGFVGRADAHRRLDVPRVARASREDGADLMGGTWHAYRSVALGVAWRTTHNALTTPNILIPSIAFPLFFFTAFVGGLSQLSGLPGFDFPAGYTAFQFVFVLLQSAAFGGVFTGFGIARDFEYGFSRRLMLAAPHRSAILVGYGLAAIARWGVTAVVLVAVALALGMDVLGNGVEVVGLFTLALLVNMVALCWAAGIATRFRSLQAGPLMQMPVFLILFFAPVYVPLTLLSGWIHTVATVNPVTYLLEAGRSLVSGAPEYVALAFGAAFCLLVVFAVWAALGMRRAEAAGGWLVQQPGVDRGHEPGDDAATRCEAVGLDVLPRRVVLAAHRAQAVERGEALRRRPGAVGDSARRRLAEDVAELPAERDGGLGEPSDPLRPLQGRRAAEILVRELDALVVAECGRPLERPGEILVRPGAEVGRQGAGARHGVEPLPGLEPRDLEREAPARAVELADPQRLAGERERRIPPFGGRLTCVCGPPRGVNAEPARSLAARHDLAVRAPALEAEDSVHAEQPAARRRAAVPGLLVRHAHDLEQAERPRPLREQPSRVQGDRDAALHVGDARPVAALPLPAERPCGGGARGKTVS